MSDDELERLKAALADCPRRLVETRAALRADIERLEGEKMVKVTVDLPSDAIEAAKRLAAKRGITMTQAIRDALELEFFVARVLREGGRLIVKREDEGYREVIFR